MLRELQSLGHEPTCFAFYGLSGGRVTYDGYECLPNSDFDAWGNDVIQAHLNRSKSDALITLMDLFVLNPDIYLKLGKPWIAWTPIDSETIGAINLNMLKVCTHPVAMSIFGADQMANQGIEVQDYIYHAVDTDVFKPLDKAECRDVFGLPQDSYIVGMVMANKGDRKQYPQQLLAINDWWEKEHKGDKLNVFIHTEPTAIMGGWDMPALVEKVGLKGRVLSTNQYDTSVVPFSSEQMSMLYNCFDVLMNCSAGEGFGIPIIEAQACGVPVVTHGVTTMPEITHNGYTVEPAAKGLGAHFGWQFMPSYEDMMYRLECVYRMSDSTSAQAGRDWVEANCSVPIIAAQWDDLLKRVEEENAPLGDAKEPVKIS